MKKLLLVFAVTVLFCISVYSQEMKTETIEESGVPESVITTFKSDYSGVSVIRWEKHTYKGKQGKIYTKYVSIFDENGLRNRSRYKADGTGISVTTYYWFKNVEKLPDAVKKYAESKHPDFKLNSGEKIKSHKSGKYVYRIHLKKGASKLDVYLNEKGEEVSKDNVDQDILDTESESL